MIILTMLPFLVLVNLWECWYIYDLIPQLFVQTKRAEKLTVCQVLRECEMSF